MKHVVIIGNGISGITAARNIRKRCDFAITVISEESKYFYSRTALMYVYMGHLKLENIKPYEDQFWAENRISLIYNFVEKIKPVEKQVCLSDGQTVQYDVLILATGSKSKELGVEGENLEGIQSLYSIQDLQLLERNTHPFSAKRSEHKVKNAAIIGAGLIGIELAEMLHSRGILVNLIVKDDHIWSSGLSEAESDIIEYHIRQHGIQIRKNTRIKKFIGNPEGKVSTVEFESGDLIYCELVGITIGVQPNVRLAQDASIQCNSGVLVDPFLATNIEGIYAIGDCAEQRIPLHGRKTIEPVWYTGRMMGEVVAETISGTPCVYAPGPWFNSAKFFGLEYQCYGSIGSHEEKKCAEFFWKNLESTKSIRITYDETTNQFLGFSSIGIRWRHEVLHHWLEQYTSVSAVLDQLEKADFESEFSRRFIKEIRQSFEHHKSSQAN